MISPLKPILTFFGVKDGKIEATALKRIADSLNNLINTYVAWADTVGQDYSISNFIKWLKNSQGEIVATELRMYALKAATLALNMVFAMFASWAISAGMNAFINWMKNAKTHSEQLISTMEDAHDAAEEAQQDVDDIQQKLDDLDQKVKDIGAEKIEDIVDPQEKAKIQEINNLLETQLRLKKQIADDENNKANKAASDVFNDKSEVVVSNETPTSYAEADPNGIGVTVTQSKNVTRTEALREHTARVNELSDAYVKLMSDENVDTTTISFEQLTDAIKGYGTAMDKAKEKTDAIKSAFSGLSEVMNNKTDRNNPFGLLDSDDVEKQHNALMQLAKDTNVFKSKAYNPETGEVDFNSKAFKDSVVEYLNGMADAAAQTGGAGAKAIEKNWRDAAKAIADGKISVEEFYNGLGYSLEKATKEIDDFQSGFSDITDIVDEYNLYGGLSIDNYQKLMALSPEYLSCLKLEGDQLVFNEAAYKQLLIDKLNEMIATYEQTDATKELAKRLKELRDGLLNSKTGFKDAKDAVEEFKSAMSNLKEILSSVLSIFKKFNDKSNNDLKIWGDTMNKVIDKRIEALNKQKEALEENNEATERAIELSRAQDALARAEQQRTTRVYTENGYEWQANAEDVRTAREDLADKKREWNKKDAEKAIDDQIKKYNEFKDKLSEVIQNNKINAELKKD